MPIRLAKVQVPFSMIIKTENASKVCVPNTYARALQERNTKSQRNKTSLKREKAQCMGTKYRMRDPRLTS